MSAAGCLRRWLRRQYAARLASQLTGHITFSLLYGLRHYASQQAFYCFQLRCQSDIFVPARRCWLSEFERHLTNGAAFQHRSPSMAYAAAAVHGIAAEVIVSPAADGARRQHTLAAGRSAEKRAPGFRQLLPAPAVFSFASVLLQLKIIPQNSPPPRCQSAGAAFRLKRSQAAQARTLRDAMSFRRFSSFLSFLFFFLLSTPAAAIFSAQPASRGPFFIFSRFLR